MDVDKKQSYEIIKPKRSKLQDLAKLEPQAAPGNVAFTKRPGFWPFMACVGIWALLSHRAYIVWKNKPEEEEDEEEPEPEFDKRAFVTPSTPRKWYQSVTYEERGFLQFQLNTPLGMDEGNAKRVLMNDRYERFEIVTRLRCGYFVQQVAYDDIIRDENGHFAFDESGLPVEKRWKITMKLTELLRKSELLQQLFSL